MFNRFAIYLLVSMTSIMAASAQIVPTITYVANDASYQAPGLPAAGIAQGSIFTLFGANLVPSTCDKAIAFPLPITICNVSVTVTVNGKSTSPYLLGVYNTDQINAILPSNTPTGTGTITVTYNNQNSATFPIQVVDAAFGEFSTNGEGFGQASVTDTNYQLNTILHPLHPGDIGILWGTGLGAVAGSDATTPPPFGNVGSPTVYVGNTALTPGTQLLYAGRSGSWPGLDQINFVVPPGVNGCNVPIAVATDTGVGNVETIAVAPAGQNTCTDSVMGQNLVNKLAAGSPVNFGYVRMERSGNTLITGIDTMGEQSFASFSTYSPQTAFLAEYGVSSGYCVVNQNGTTRIADSQITAVLDAGTTLNLQGPQPLQATWRASTGDPGYYAMRMSYSVGGYILGGYNYTASGPGGADVGAFSASLAVPTTVAGFVKFTGISTEQNIPRGSDYTVRWTGGDPNMQNGQVTIGGFSASNSPVLFNAFQCTAPLAANSFTIPGWVLSALPQSQQFPINGLTVPLGYIWIGQYSAPVEFSATGLDRGIFTYADFLGYLVNYQ